MPGVKRKGRGDAWYLEVTLGTDFTGKPLRYNRTFHGTEKQAEKALALFYAECDAGKVSRESSVKISELCDIFEKEYIERFLKISSRRGVRTATKIWIKPLLGSKKVSKLKRLDVQKFVNHLSDNGLSPKTIRNYYSVLKTMMEFAVKMEIVDDTPCQHITLPKKEDKEAEYYSVEEMASFLDALEKLPDEELVFKAAAYIALFGGLRKSEILGLNWEDVDFEGGTIRVRRNRMIAPDIGVYEDTPKSKKGNRAVSLPPEVFAVLHDLKAQQAQAKLLLGEKYVDSPALLRGSGGAPLYPNRLQAWLPEFVEKNDLPHITLHGLRHTHASMLAYMKADEMQISRRMGHAQLSTTLNIYTHLFEKTDKKIAEALSATYLSAK